MRSIGGCACSTAISVRLFDSYHCSRYNTNTGRLTAAMFKRVFRDIARYLNRERSRTQTA